MSVKRKVTVPEGRSGMIRSFAQLDMVLADCRTWARGIKPEAYRLIFRLIRIPGNHYAVSWEGLGGPPVEAGVGFEALRIGLEGAAAADQHRLERIEVGEGAVGDWLVDEGPQPFGRLQFRRGRGQQHHVDAFWQHQIVGDVPAGLVDHQHGTVVGVDALIAREGGQGEGQGRCCHVGSRHHQLRPVAGHTKP